MGNVVGGLSTALGLFASPILILSTESVVAIEWKGMSTSGARQLQQGLLQSTCSCPSTPSPKVIRSKVSSVDLRRAPARCSIRPVHRSKLQVALCSRADASHGLFMCVNVLPGRAITHGVRLLEYTTACRSPSRTCTELYGSATSVWVKVSPQSELLGPSSAGFAPGISSYGRLPLPIDVLIEV